MKIMIVAGEASSDRYAALLAGSLKKLQPDVEIFGMGGSRLREAGVETAVDSEKSGSVMGLTEVANKLSEIRRAFKKLVLEARSRKPDVIVVLDYAEFNMLLAKKLHKQFRFVYLIPPQVWAWRKGRVKKIKQRFKKVLSIFPFEEKFYQAHGVDVSFIGHPLTMLVPPKDEKSRAFERLGIEPGRRVVGLLPGSRRAEITRLLPTMLLAFKKLMLDFPDLQAVIPLAPGLDEELVRDIIRDAGVAVTIKRSSMDDVLLVADAVVVASGTATVEVALAGVPMIIVYKLSRLSYSIGRRLVKGVQHFGMPNLILQREAFVELLQEKVTPRAIRDELYKILVHPEYAETLKKSGSEMRERLAAEGDGSPLDRAAREIVAVVQQQ
jgi:lipid-A-disaccharide synthase